MLLQARFIEAQLGWGTLADAAIESLPLLVAAARLEGLSREGIDGFYGCRPLMLKGRANLHFNLEIVVSLLFVTLVPINQMETAIARWFRIIYVIVGVVEYVR